MNQKSLTKSLIKQYRKNRKKSGGIKNKIPKKGDYYNYNKPRHFVQEYRSKKILVINLKPKKEEKKKI